MCVASMRLDVHELTKSLFSDTMLLVHSLIAVALWCAPGAQSAMVSQAVTYQAEDGVLTGVMVANLTSGFQGTGWLSLYHIAQSTTTMI